MNFLLPAGLTADAVRELERACVVGGPDYMPWPTRAHVDSHCLTVSRAVDESGSLAAPWNIDGVGRLMAGTATLMERDLPYHLQVELARGKLNQLRGQVSDWRSGGLQVPSALAQQIQDATLTFGKAITLLPAEEAGKLADTALSLGCQAAEQLVHVYMNQLFPVRHYRQARLETSLGCRLGTRVPQRPNASALIAACNNISLPFVWREIEPTESSYLWEPQDSLLDWVEDQGLPVTAGPLIDFSPTWLPGWLGSWEHDLHSVASFMCDYVETAVKRYHGRIHCWQLTSASNCAVVLGLNEDELLWLTVRLAEAARQIDSDVELVVGLAQPWGEYMATEERSHSPFIFADTLIRAGLNLAAVDLEWIMGVSPRGSYCRDLLDASRLLDLYALLGVPLQVTLGYPSSSPPEGDHAGGSGADKGSGHWHNGFDLDVQADWAASFAALALCKPFVRAVQWVHYSDAEPHQFPHCGLVDVAGNLKPALPRLRELREQHLR